MDADFVAVGTLIVSGVVWLAGMLIWGRRESRKLDRLEAVAREPSH